jgi:phosphoribosylformylglycinamidine (FGAM) synthase PurS component
MLVVRAESAEAAQQAAEVMSKKLLANPVTEDFVVELIQSED